MKTRISFFAFLIFSFLNLISSAQVSSLNLWPDGIPGFIVNDTYIEKATVANGMNSRFEKVTSPATFPLSSSKGISNRNSSSDLSGRRI